MSELKPQHNLEAEIAELNREIEAKRAQLEEERGVVEEREVVSHVLAQHVFAPDPVNPVATNPLSGARVKAATDDYLDTLDPETVEAINTLISAIPNIGIKRVIAQARNEHPFILDAFHDALVNKLYEELKTRGLV